MLAGCKVVGWLCTTEAICCMVYINMQMKLLVVQCFTAWYFQVEEHHL